MEAAMQLGLCMSPCQTGKSSCKVYEVGISFLLALNNITVILRELGMRAASWFVSCQTSAEDKKPTCLEHIFGRNISKLTQHTLPKLLTSIVNSPYRIHCGHTVSMDKQEQTNRFTHLSAFTKPCSTTASACNISYSIPGGNCLLPPFSALVVLLCFLHPASDSARHRAASLSNADWLTSRY